ncbi:MAG: hypothetical protein ACPG9T_11910 [Pseudomonadales bacterium]
MPAEPNGPNQSYWVNATRIGAPLAFIVAGRSEGSDVDQRKEI